MTEKRFISKGESIINVATDELVNASSEESAEIIVMWLNTQHEQIVRMEKGLLDCVFNNKSVDKLAEELGLIE